MIKFQDVSFEYERGNETLKNLTFSIGKGETIGIIGPNGAGKTTLFNVLLGILPHEGDILVDGLPVCRENHPVIRQKLGMVLQNSDNQMFMPTVFEDMMFGPLNYGVEADEAERRIDRILEEMGITHLKHRHNHKISGGEKRIAAIATVLAMEPDAVIMDEPTSSLDPGNRRRVIGEINRLHQTKVIASHDLDMILETCERVILLSGGRIRADGPAGEILRDRELLEENGLELPLSLGRPSLGN